MSLFDHVGTIDVTKNISNNMSISGISDLTISDVKRSKEHEIVIVNSQTNLIFISDCSYAVQLGEYLIYLRNDLIDLAKITYSSEKVCISFNRPWYVLDYKYVIELNEGKLEYDKISSGRYFTHSEKENKHIYLYTLLVFLFIIFFLIIY